MTKRRIAVIGSGVSGITAGYVLSHTDYVTIFEADGRLGGHADTHLVTPPSGPPLGVDIGFIVYNERTYPLLTRLFAELGVATQPAEMSMSVRCAGCRLQYAGRRGLGGLTPGLLQGPERARYLQMLAEIPRFHRAARRVLARPDHAKPPTLGEFLRARRFGPYFTAHFALPLVAAVWSCPPGTALRYPARYLFAFLANHGMLSVSGSPPWRTVTGGSRHYVEQAGAPVMVLRRPREFYRRFGASGLIGFGESYLAGDWDAADRTGNDLTALLTVFAEHAAELVPPWLQRLRTLAVRRQPHDDLQTVTGARRNIGRHYDLSNDLFALFLDETMTYSAAVFAGLGDTGPDDRPSADQLADAQRRKIDRLLDRAGVSRGCRVLEIGTGWGELAVRAARRGATVRTVTISREQAELATRRIAAAGLAGQVHVELCDYRDVEGRFDAICSVEMLEAVGERYWDTFFAVLDQHLAPGGRVGLQTITMAHDRMLATRNTYTWIQKYIFPGGLLPSVTAIGDSLSRTRLRIVQREDYGPHYAQTLRIWRERFGAHADEVARLGFDEVFRRMWDFYLSYSEAGFLAGYIDVSQLTLARI